MSVLTNEEVVADMKQLIENGMSKQALNHAVLNDPLGRIGDLDFMYQLWISLALEGHMESARLLRGRIIRHSEYNRIDDGDCWRELAVAQFRKGDLQSASESLAIASAQHKWLRSQLAAIDMLKGRIAFAQGKYYDAIMDHVNAFNRWREVDKSTNDPWVRENSLHWLRATLKLKMRSKEMELMYYRTLKDETSLKRRFVLWALWHFPRFGEWLCKRTT